MPLSRHAHSARFGSERPSALSPSPSSRVAFGDSGALFRRCAAVASKRIMMNRKSFAPRTSPSVPFQAASGLGATARNASDLQGQARNWGGGRETCSHLCLPSVLLGRRDTGLVRSIRSSFLGGTHELRSADSPLLRCSASVSKMCQSECPIRCRAIPIQRTLRLRSRLLDLLLTRL